LFAVLQEADAAPTAQATAAATEIEQTITPLLQQWEAIKTQEIPKLNEQLRSGSLPELKAE